MEGTANRIVSHYERHALAWDADRRAASWIDKPHIERFLSVLAKGATVLDLGCGAVLRLRSTWLLRAFASLAWTAPRRSFRYAEPGCQEWVVGDMRSLTPGRRFDGILAWDSFFHLRHDDQRTMFSIFALHAAPAAILMFNAGFGHGEAVGSYRGDPLYHASLDASEYVSLLTNCGFELIEHSINDPAKGGRIFWLARRTQSYDG
jgi:hypothetical protein